MFWMCEVGSLHDLLRSFYCPLLLRDDGGASNSATLSLPPKMQKMLTDLEVSDRSIDRSIDREPRASGSSGDGARKATLVALAQVRIGLSRFTTTNRVALCRLDAHRRGGDLVWPIMRDRQKIT